MQRIIKTVLSMLMYYKVSVTIFLYHCGVLNFPPISFDPSNSCRMFLRRLHTSSICFRPPFLVKHFQDNNYTIKEFSFEKFCNADAVSDIIARRKMRRQTSIQKLDV
jgi:hypothetical protein